MFAIQIHTFYLKAKIENSSYFRKCDQVTKIKLEIDGTSDKNKIWKLF